MADKSKTFNVPQAVRDAAERGIELRREHGRGGLDTKQAKEAGVGSGVQRASNLMQGSVSYETVKRMLAFFNRHKAFKVHHKDRTSASYISWLLWGGDAGFAWAKRTVKAEEKVEKGSFRYLTLGLDDIDEPVFDEPIGGEPIGGHPILSFSELVKAATKAKEVVAESEQALEMLDGEDLDEITEEQALALHKEDPMIISAEPFTKAQGQSEEPQPLQDEEGEEEDEEDLDDTLDAEDTPPYKPQLVIDHALVRSHVKKALRIRRTQKLGSSRAKNIGLSLQRGQYARLDMDEIEGYLDGLGGDDPDDHIDAQIMGGHLMLEILERAEPHVPAKYLEGLTGEERAKRKKQIQARIKGKNSYKPMAGDKDAKTKPSKYSKTRLAGQVRDEIKSSGKEEFLRAAAKVGDAPKGILREVYDRGLKAWATSGHRVGATAQAWAKARVYSFLTNGKTTKTGDKDLYEKWKSK